MSKKTKVGKKPQKAQATGLALGSQLLTFTRQPANQAEQLELLATIESALEAAYQVVRLMPTGTQEEEECLEGIRQLEDQRFFLLSEIHGSQVQAYQ